MLTTGVWRHAQRLPAVAPEHRISLGEGGTPLVPLPRWGAALGLARAFAKLEYANPTGSFKDRGMSVLVSLAKQMGAQHLTEDSSGNAGAAAAAYAARAGMTCTVYAPESAPAAKLRQIRAYGAELVLVPGARSAVTQAARDAGTAPGSYYVAHTENADFLHGNQAFAWELTEAWQGGGFGAAPSEVRAWHVVTPAGGGALLQGAWLGFTADRKAYGSLGLPLPQVHGAQAAAVAPLARAFELGLDEPAPIEPRPTVCGGIQLERPAHGREILRAIRESGGSAVASEDDAVLREHDRLAQLEGIYCEPTSAAALAGLAQLAAGGRIAADEIVVVAITGSGLKDPGPQA
ncbi:MAG TPA: pyridoxal-phosphate dependent enzyme [Chloroflexota bacterium]|nr:pyridoxal-phosphate dependent enzyme [Chloroflexota bacterium]